MLAAEPEGPPDDLTERELDVLRLIALGHTNAEIGHPAASLRPCSLHDSIDAEA